ncbi:MAG TPA: nucleotidyltransferase domain-containing protein [Bacillales bacterium]|nr:nucleotidyltransferase domain-containing protein [Bacillales bacterium]
MDEIAEKVNQSVMNYLQDVSRRVKINKAFLYGSYATGNYDEQSDVDVAIFSENFNNQSSVEINAFLFSIARKYKDICIEPIGFNESDIKADNPFVKEILRTGKEIIA